GSSSSTGPSAGSTGDPRDPGLPGLHGQAPGARAPLRDGGDDDPAGGARRLCRRLHRRRRSHALHVHAHVALRELRGAHETACRAAGARGLASVPRQDPAADPQAGEQDPDSDGVLAVALMGSLDGKVAIVTGAAQGIGRAIADGLAAEGARIVVADLRGAGAAAASYEGGGGLDADVADEAAVRRMVDQTLEQCGGIDVLVNNAGLYASLAMRPFTEIPLEEWRQVMDVNVASMFLTCRAVVP